MRFTPARPPRPASSSQPGHSSDSHLHQLNSSQSSGSLSVRSQFVFQCNSMSIQEYSVAVLGRRCGPRGTACSRASCSRRRPSPAASRWTPASTPPARSRRVGRPPGRGGAAPVLAGRFPDAPLGFWVGSRVGFQARQAGRRETARGCACARPQALAQQRPLPKRKRARRSSARPPAHSKRPQALAQQRLQPKRKHGPPQLCPPARALKVPPCCLPPCPAALLLFCPEQESLRKYSVVPVVTRNLVADDELSGCKLPAGAWVIVHIQVGLLFCAPQARIILASVLLRTLPSKRWVWVGGGHRGDPPRGRETGPSGGLSAVVPVGLGVNLGFDFEIGPRRSLSGVSLLWCV